MVVVFSDGNGSDFENNKARCIPAITVHVESLDDPVLAANLESKLVVDETAQTITLAKFEDSIELAGGLFSTSRDYTVTANYTLTGPWKENPVSSNEVSFTWTIVNPCLITGYTDPNNICTISTVPPVLGSLSGPMVD